MDLNKKGDIWMLLDRIDTDFSKLKDDSEEFKGVRDLTSSFESLMYNDLNGKCLEPLDTYYKAINMLFLCFITEKITPITALRDLCDKYYDELKAISTYNEEYMTKVLRVQMCLSLIYNDLQKIYLAHPNDYILGIGGKVNALLIEVEREITDPSGSFDYGCLKSVISSLVGPLDIFKETLAIIA